MRSSLAFLALPLALGLVTGAADAAPTREDAEACAQLIERDEPLAQQELRCAEVSTAFRADTGADAPAINPDSLRDWALTQPASAASIRHAAPDTGAVAGILAQLTQEQQHAGHKPSLWERLRRWLQSLLDRGESQASSPGWLSKVFQALSRIPAGAVRATFWTLVAILAALLAWIIVIELRASGVFARSAAPPRARGAVMTDVAMQADAGAAAIALDDIVALAPERRAPALLRWLLRALAEQRLLNPDATLTNGELAERLPATMAQEFRRFLRCVEPALYGGNPLMDPVLMQARSLASDLAGTVNTALQPARTGNRGLRRE